MKSISISKVCRLIGISRQKYYRQCWSITRSREIATKIVEIVNDLRMEMPRLGGRKIYHLLGSEMNNLHVGRDKMFAILRANHLLITPHKSYHVTTNSHHRFRKHKNTVSNLEITRPEQVWVSDITYLGRRNNHMYLSLITDAYSKKIMGYDLSNSLDTKGSINALKMAYRKRIYPKEKLIHHSDRGIQYCSNIYQRRLKKYQITTSMTESYDPYANAIAERINGILKQEFLLEDIHLDFKSMKSVIKDAIHIYNTRRPHYSCAYMTPEMMHQQKRIKIRTYKNKHLRKKSLAETN